MFFVQDISGRAVYVGRAMKKTERAAWLRREYDSKRKEMAYKSRGVNLYVKNLIETFDDNKLRQAFEEFGSITRYAVLLSTRPSLS